MKKQIFIAVIVLLGLGLFASQSWAPPVISPGGGGAGGVAGTYSSAWNGDVNSPQKNDVYDYLHLLDTNDDGDIDTIDATLWATKQSVSAVGIYDPTPDTDQTYTCIECWPDQTAGENLTWAQTVYLASDGSWSKTDSDLEATSGGLKIAMVADVAGIASAATGTLMLKGIIRDDSASFTGTISAPGKPLYIQGETVGDAGWWTETAPSGSGYVKRLIGYAKSTTILVFDPSDSYTVHP